MKKQSTTLLFFGEALKTFGVNGELVVKLNPDLQDDLNIKEPLFIIFDGLTVPFYVRSFESRGNHKLIMAFDDIDNEFLATELTGKKLYYASTSKHQNTNDDLSYFIGYTLIDGGLGKLGVITDFFDYPGNPCFQTYYNDKEVLVPINEDLIGGIDDKNKTILLALPEGLLDIYLND